MTGRYYFLLTSLPALADLGAAPPMDLAELRDRVASESKPHAAALIDAILLEGDLVLREAAQAGEIERPAPAVLTPGQADGTEPLPEALADAEPDRPRRIPADRTWEAYWRHAARAADAARCPFARQWVGFEVALRNGLATARARTLGLDAHDYLVAEDLAAESAPDEIIAAAAPAADPLAALRALDEARWRWVLDNEGYYSFAIDELAAYARKLALATRWHLIGQPQRQRRSVEV